MREITDTANKYQRDPLPEGMHQFMVSGEPKKRFGKSEFWIWPVQWAGGIGEVLLMPNMMGGLLRVLGFKEVEPSKFDWDTTECEGKAFIATVKIVPDKKDPTKMRTHMGDFALPDKVEEIAF